MVSFLPTMVRVSNPDETVTFLELLGVKETRRFSSEQGKFTLIYLACPGQDYEVELTYNWPAEDGSGEIYTGGRNFGHLAFRVDDIYATCQTLMEAGITINRCWFIVKVRIDVGHHSPLGMTSEPGPANCSRIGAAPAHTPGNLRSITQPEISRIKKPKGSLAKQQGRHLQCRFARTFPMDANKMVVRKVRADEARLSIIAALLETEQVRLKGMDPVEGQSPSVVPMIYPIVGKAVTNVKTHDFDHIRDVVGHAI